MADLAKVKRNVAKMVDLGAPEADIDAYIESEGVTLDEVRALPRQQAEAFRPKDAPAFSGAILPFSRSQAGETYFDSDAGLLGVAKRALSLPGDVYARRVDPGSDEAIERSFELATLASPVNPSVRAGDAALPGARRVLRRQHVEPPTAQALKDTAARGYDEARAMGVDYDIRAVSDLASTVRAGLERDGILDELAPKTFSIIKRLENPPAGAGISLTGVEAARRALGEAAKDFSNPTEQTAALRAISALRGFVENPPAESVVAGPAVTAGRLYREADANYGAGKRSDKLHGIEEVADLNAAVANSGQNIDNAIRQRARDIIDPRHPKRRAGYSAAEIRAITNIAMGAKNKLRLSPRNTLRFFGNALGGGGGLGALASGTVGAGLGALAGGPLGAPIGTLAVPATGYALKKGANALTRRALNEADALVRQRSPLYERMLQEAPMEAPAALKRAAALRALMLSMQNQNRRA